MLLSAGLQASGLWEAGSGLGVATGGFTERVTLANVVLALSTGSGVSNGRRTRPASVLGDANGIPARDSRGCAHRTAECATADRSEMLETVLARLKGGDCHTIPVTEHRALIGLVTLDSVEEFLIGSGRGTTRARRHRGGPDLRGPVL